MKYLVIFLGVIFASLLIFSGSVLAAEAKPSPTPALAETPQGPEVVLDMASLIDYFICLGAGVWLCLGALALVSIPLIFFALHSWGKRRLERKA